MPKFQTRRGFIDAFRYGTEEAGAWYQGAVYDLAEFLLGRRPTLDGEIWPVLRPVDIWDPPSESQLQVYLKWQHGAHWSRIDLGDWVIRFPDGNLSTCSNEDLLANWEKVEV